MKSNRRLNNYVRAIALAILATASLKAQWIQVAGVPTTDIGSLYISNNTIFAGTDSAVYISADSGNTWTRSATLPLSPMLIDALTVFDGKIFAGTGGNGVFVSSNNGQSWTSMNQGLVGLGSNQISSFAERNGVLYAGTVGAGVFRLNLTTWNAFGNLVGETAGNVAFIRLKGDTLVAGAGGNGYVWFAPNGVTTWSGVLIAPLQVEPLIATSLLRVGNSLLLGSTYGIFRSTNEGAIWTFSGAGGPLGRLVALTSLNGALYAFGTSSDTRVYRSTDGGSTWQRLETIPATYAVAALGNRLYAATLQGLRYTTFGSTDVDEEPLPNRATLNQNYPNPFNPSTTIRFSVPASSVSNQASEFITLKVFNLLGQEIRTLAQQKLVAGEYTIEFNASDLPSGVYFYRLTSGGFAATKRMMLLK